MANPYTVTLRSIADDGTNTYCLVEISSGTTTMPLIQATFPTGVTAATLKTYMQTIANNQPTIATALGALLNVPTQGV